MITPGLRLLALSALCLSGLPGCAEEGGTAAAPQATAPQAADAQKALPEGVTLVSSSVSTEGDALRGAGTLRFPWSGASQDVTYMVTGTPAATPEVYDVQATEAKTGATARLVYQIEQGSVAVEVPGHVAELTHNPDGSFSLGGQVYASLREAAGALVADVNMAPLSAELLAAATIGLGAATRAASPRIPDGWCDPLWTNIDPDCRDGARALPETYTCERWGQESEGCAFFQAYQP